MGLMLSVLVFCVGVAEILDCWHHFLLHLVQPQYNPLPPNFDLKSDYLSQRELSQTLSQSRKSSGVDISWPKDLSPDEIHVLKKRVHVENDGDSEVHRTIKKSFHCEKSHSVSPHERFENVSHTTDAWASSPVSAMDISPDGVELSVIVESDSSSCEDENSQIENLNNNIVNLPDNIQFCHDIPEETQELKNISDILNVVPKNQSGDSEECIIVRPKSPFPKILEELGGKEIDHIDNDNVNKPDSIIKIVPDLPVFTDNIISQDVKKVSVRYPTSSQSLLNTASLESSGAPVDSKEQNLLPITAILDEGLEPIPEFPEIKVQESSPVPQGEDSDSSLNTSDASWMVRSKTSDRPLVIRFSPSPEKVKKAFQSVVETDLRALGNENAGPNPKKLEKAESLDIYYDAQADNEIQGECEYHSCEKSANENFYLENNISNERPTGVDINSSMNIFQVDSNSSSSSLSGIPQIPEDSSDIASHISMPTDNYFSEISEITSNNNSTSFGDIPTFSNTSDIPIQLVSQPSTLADEKYENGSLPGAMSVSPSSAAVETIDVVNNQTNVSDIPENMVQGTFSSKYENQFTGSENDKTDSSDISQATFQTISCSKKDIEIGDSENINENNFDQFQDVYQARSSPDKENISSENVVLECVSLPKENTGGNNVKSESKDNDMLHDSDEKDGSKENKSLDSHESDVILRHEQSMQYSSNEIDKSNSKTSEIVIPELNCNDKFPESADSGNKSEISDSNQNSSLAKNSSCHPPTSRPNNSIKENIPTHSVNETNLKPHSETSVMDDSTLLCHEKATEEEDLTETRTESATLKTKASAELKKPPEKSASIKSDPSKTSDVATASTSKNEEDKSFWLIFSGEYTKAMNKDWHSGHFCCWQCDESLTGQRYVLRDEHPYCVKCYESVFANGCEECNKIIGIDSKDLSYKDKHWHEACFLCNKCRVSLVDKQFGSKLDKIFCGNCYDQQFASRCDGCGQIFKAGTKKMEYKTRQWHEPCFACCVCKQPIGTKSFIPREQEIYCSSCYEDKFATRCVKCNKIITSGGVTYKNEPWHRDCFTCTNCNTSLAGQRFTSRDEKPYCAECFGELFAKRCTACSKPITGIGGTRFISFEDRHWHNDCFICASCKTSLVGRGFITDGDDIICPECAKQKLM